MAMNKMINAGSNTNTTPLKNNEFNRVARTALFIEKLKRHSKLRFDQMTCWARYKYDEKLPALRIHIWDIFDDALAETKDFDSFFNRIYTKLLDEYKKQGFDFEQEELVQSHDSSGGKSSRSNDSAHADLVSAINNLPTTNTNLFDLKKQQTLIEEKVASAVDESVVDESDFIEEMARLSSADKSHEEQVSSQISGRSEQLKEFTKEGREIVVDELTNEIFQKK